MTHTTSTFTAIGTLLAAGALSLAGTTASADQVILDDLIVDGSACFGFDCVNGESFGFDTIRLKENNMRIRAVDTSSTASFPSNDWQIVFNDSSNGGANKFAVDDIDGGRTPFTIEAGARTNALYVEDDGDIGIGTNIPVVNLHVVDGNTPTLRLEQNGTSGFTPQTWDLAGNETNLFIRDATNGSTLPFRIRPGAPTSAIDIEGTTGDVGFGTSSPSDSIHIRRTNKTAGIRIEESSATNGSLIMLTLENKGNPEIELSNTNISDQWRISGGNSFIIKDVNGATTTNVFTLTEAGDLTITGGLTTTGATCNVTPCDAVFDPEVYTVPSIEEHAAFMWENKFLPAIGPTSADVPVNLTDKVLTMLNELEHAHIYIAQLNSELKAQGEVIKALQAELAVQ